MEANRILHAAVGWLILAIFASGLSAQESPQDTIKLGETSSGDTERFTPSVSADTVVSDTLWPIQSIGDTTGAEMDTTATSQADLAQDTLTYSLYQAREFISIGPPDDIKSQPAIFLSQHGPVGSPAIPFDYLDVVGANVSINGLPFTYNGIYRPYIIGIDLNTIPWEILNGIEMLSLKQGVRELNFLVGPPADRINRSDFEASRGPYGYSGTRWRFFRPFGKRTFAYFTLGFKKSDGFIAGADYDGHHVTGGVSRKMAGGDVAIDLWTHRARTGPLTFDFLTPQQSRQSRTLTRSEVSYRRPLATPLFLSLTSLYHRTDQTVTGYGSNLSIKNDIAGGEVLVTDSLPGATLSIAANYYRGLLYGLSDSRPEFNHTYGRIGIDNHDSQLLYAINLAYEWNKIDQEALLPSAIISYGLNDEFKPYFKAFRARGIPDLLTRNLRDHVVSTGAPEFISSYTFAPNPDLDTPLLSQLTLGMQVGGNSNGVDFAASYKRIESQVYTSYNFDSEKNLSVSPANFDDSYFELSSTARIGLWVFKGDLGGSMRFWENKDFPDGIEKGPTALGIGKLSFRKEIFIPKFLVGGLIEARFSSRRDYRSLISGTDDAFVVFDGRLEFQYKDFVFWVNDENLTNEKYITWWPYYESPRIVWWGLRWSFLD